MAFNYNLSSPNADIVLVSKVRLELGDTVLNSGVLPSGANLQDEEIQLYLTAHSNNISQASGALAGILSRHWAVAADVQVGPRKESLSQVAEAWRKQATDLSVTDGSQSFVIDLDRTDGYDVG